MTDINGHSGDKPVAGAKRPLNNDLEDLPDEDDEPVIKKAKRPQDGFTAAPAASVSATAPVVKTKAKDENVNGQKGLPPSTLVATNAPPKLSGGSTTTAEHVLSSANSPPAAVSKVSSATSTSASSASISSKPAAAVIPKVKSPADESDDDDAPLIKFIPKKTSVSATVTVQPTSSKAAKKQEAASKPAKRKQEEDDDEEDGDNNEEEEDVDMDGGEDDEEEDEEEEEEAMEEESDEDDGKKKKRGKQESKKRKKPASKSGEGGRSKKLLKGKTGKMEFYDPNKYQQLEAIQPLVPVKGAYKWWNEKKPPHGVKWTTLQHNGVLFAPPYEAHGVKMLYDGKPVDLTPEQEEVATWYAVMLDTDHVKNPIFNKNFFKDWSKLLGKDHVIKELSKCNFRPIYDWAMAERDKKKERAKLPEVKEANKKAKELEKQIYGYALVDGHREQVGNYKVEPPGLFRGRGQHPKTGKIKERIVPEQVIINIAKGVPIPKCPMPGHNWKGIVHNPEVTWLAFWNNNINGDFKYVFLAANSRFKGESDMAKYEKARKLKKYIESIRASYRSKFTDKVATVRQLATAVYLIDKLALRVGNEKDTSEVADTVGCCSLRGEHLSFPAENTVLFDFLGKDSMRYFNQVEVDPLVYKNLRDFCAGKKPTQDVFDRISTTMLNNHLGEFMPGLTAKVFRTYNASITLQQELTNPAHDIALDELVVKKKLFYDRANKEVAILCNHQRTPPKTFDVQMEKMKEKHQELEEQKESLLEWLDELTGKKKKGAAKAVKSEDGPKRSTDPDVVRKQIQRLDQRLATISTTMQNKADLKQVALGTSKINYMDPRITVAWCKRKDVPIEKIFSKTLLQKFPWAMEVSKDWGF